MSSGGIFYLDEDRDKESPPSTSPRNSPSPNPPTQSQQSPSPPAPSSSGAVPTTSTLSLHVPPQPQPAPSSLLAQTQPFGRKSGVFGATPSFPSPLAQAITVPSHSDDSSASAGSATESDGESDIPILETNTPQRRVGSAKPRSTSTSTSSPGEASTSRRPPSRPPSPARQALTPGALLMNRVKRSGSGSLLASTGPPSGLSKHSPPRSGAAPSRSDTPRDQPSPSPSRQGSTTSGSSGRNTLSETGGNAGSSPLAFGSPELEPAAEPLVAPRPIAAMSPGPSRDRHGNILGLGWVANWESASSTSSGSNKDKGKSKERPPSPGKRDRETLASPIPVAGASRQRRASEFLRPSSMDLRKLPPASIATRVQGPSLSSSASMISPLNPLPSPWSEVPTNTLVSTQSEVLGSTPTSSSSAIRLNRVPTSVRLAADLIKSSQTPPLQLIDSPNSTPSVPTPNPSPVEERATLSFSPLKKRGLEPAASLPVGGLSLQNALGSPTSQRWTATESTSTDAFSSSPLSSPSPMSAPMTGHGSFPSSLSPSLSVFSDVPSSTMGDAFHRQGRSPESLGLSMVSSPTALVSPDSVAASSTKDDTSSTSTGTGLRPGSSTSTTPGSAVDNNARRQRLLAVGRRSGLAMDLAGVTSATIGDAASHANMIIQSRHAKVQRWRPSVSDDFSPPSMPHVRRRESSMAATRLSASYVDRPGHPLAWESSSDWGEPPSAKVRSASSNLTATPTMPDTSTMSREEPPHHRSIRPTSTLQPPVSSVGMDRTTSAAGSVGGIEWIDWYDCYKAYKAEKIRAEARAKNGKQEGFSAPASNATSPVVERETKHELSHPPPASSLSTEPVHLTPVTSRDDTTLAQTSTPSMAHSSSFRRRSLSLRSSMSTLDHKVSPNPKRSGLLHDRARQTSGGSNRSVSTTTTDTQLKRKKNLVTKMEGWWNAVKSNFSSEPPGAVPPQRLNPGLYPQPRIPSAPQSRRNSRGSHQMSGMTLLPPHTSRRTSSSSTRSIRPATSHMELRGASGDGSVSPSPGQTALDSGAPLARVDSAVLMPPPPVSRVVSDERRQNVARTGLEARRNQPSLRLDLDPNVIAVRETVHRSSSNVSESTGSGDNSSGSYHNRRGRTDSHPSRSSSYGFGAGLTPGVPKWDHTPYQVPTMASGMTVANEEKEDKPVAPGADLTIGSVRKHIKQRLNAAKEQCDTTLRRIIGIITVYEETRIEDSVEEPRRDYFETFSDSPTFDGVDSEDDSNMPPVGQFSRGPSRRGSISLSNSAIMSSPNRRVALLSSVPPSPRRSMSNRRRPSIVPRVVPRDGPASAAPRTLEPTYNPLSRSSSRSTSRSRSPMPTAHTRREEVVEQDKAYLVALQELIILAGDVLDLSVDQLISRPKSSVEIIQKIQKVGQAWDEHDDWPGRSWYVDILMAVASLGRVLEWWEAEKGFWNFEDDEQNEPLSFVLRPVKDTPHFDLEPTTARSESSYAVSPMVLPAQGHGDLSMSAATIILPQPVPRPETPSALSATAEDTSQRIEDLRTLCEQAKSVNIVMELSLQGEEILYVNDAIFEVIGREPEDVLDKPIAELLAPADISHFTEATENLLADDNNTVQLRFRFEVHELEETEEDDRTPGPVYIELEGVGMLIREDDEPSHTMWVMKPVTATQVEISDEAVFPRDLILSQEGVLCRICEREIVVWFFEKHNETCDAVHRLEAEINETNEYLSDLRQTAIQLAREVDEAKTNPYQELCWYNLPEWVTHNNESEVGPHGVEIRKAAPERIQELIEVLTVGCQIETPAVRDDEADFPFNVQRYLSHESEERQLWISRWQKPPTTDRALALLFSHVEEQLRRKQKAVARMQSTIRYSEKTRHEWEDKVNQMLSDDEASGSDSGSDAAGADTSLATADTTMTVTSESYPPGHRKIAPLARLPIIQSHPQRQEQRPLLLTSASATATITSTSPSATVTCTATAVPTANTSVAATPVPLVKQLSRESEARDEVHPVPVQRQLPPPRPGRVGPTEPAHARSRSDEPVSAKSDSLLSPDPTLSPVSKGLHSRSHSRKVSSTKAIREPLSPRVPSSATPSARSQPSIKDFQIIKPISRGAFGCVYLAKKVTTGDYYAIKALKKSDMIAKNQITNVKAERTILMNQASSPYVVKLFFSFQSKEYLYLVMEYLNGGDCATLVKALGGLPIEWARNYIAELVLGLEYLHARKVAHRDIKPDNLLIDSQGHIKLTDFGLSKIGLLNRQIGGPRAPYLKSSLRSAMATTRRGSSVSSTATDSPMLSPVLLPTQSMSQFTSYFPHVADSASADESSGSETGPVPKHLRQLSGATKLSSDVETNSGADAQRFVGTPDYLAPESILGGGTDDRMVDWWAVGVVLYEFLYGFPPFHAETPERVFDNVVSRRINWHDDEVDMPPEPRDLMDRLMCTNPAQRLGARGADEVKQHAFFAGINWETLTTEEAVFIPDNTDPESTDYFDLRGAKEAFQDEETSPRVLRSGSKADATPSASAARVGLDEAVADDFGAFNFKNLPVLKQANDNVIRKIRSDSIAAHSANAPDPRLLRQHRHPHQHHHHRPNRGPPSPSTSTSSAASTPSRMTSTTPGAGTPAAMSPNHQRNRSELNALARVRSNSDKRRLSQSSHTRFRAGSTSSTSNSERGGSTDLRNKTPATDMGSHGDLQLLPAAELNASPSEGGIVVLIAEDNPISQKILETLLMRMGCRCVCVQDGPEALAAAMGSVKFDLILCDIHMPYVSGEQVARMIRSTTNPNQNTPMIAATNYDETMTEQGTLFSAVLPKPFTRESLLRCLAKVGFELSAGSGASGSAGPGSVAGGSVSGKASRSASVTSTGPPAGLAMTMVTGSGIGSDGSAAADLDPTPRTSVSKPTTAV